MKNVMLLCVVGLLLGFAVAKADYLKGYLDEKGDADHFVVYAESDSLDVNFTYPDGAVFYVLVIGEKGQELGSFDLTDGEVIQLTGGGYFTMVIISHKGDGKWTAIWD